MEDERFQELLTRVANLNWVTTDWAEAFYAAYTRYAIFHCNIRNCFETDVMTPAQYDDYQKRLREFIGESRAAAHFDSLKRLREFIFAFCRDFPEWHSHSHEPHLCEGYTCKCAGSFVADFIGLKENLRSMWEFVARKEIDEAMRSLLLTKKGFSMSLNKLERATASTGTTPAPAMPSIHTSGSRLWDSLETAQPHTRHPKAGCIHSWSTAWWEWSRPESSATWA
jgi:hypothetical protein